MLSPHQYLSPGLQQPNTASMLTLVVEKQDQAHSAHRLDLEARERSKNRARPWLLALIHCVILTQITTKILEEPSCEVRRPVNLQARCYRTTLAAFRKD